MTSLNPTQCAACQRLDGYTCAAYPDGIIPHFLTEGGDHREPYQGDHGFQFVQKDSAEAQQAFEFWQEFWQPTAAESQRAGGIDAHPGDAEALHHYWTAGPGLAKWADSPKPWTTLFHLLWPEYIKNEDEAKRTANEWFHDVFHFYPGSDLNRVTHGKPPRGKVVGPG